MSEDQPQLNSSPLPTMLLRCPQCQFDGAAFFETSSPIPTFVTACPQCGYVEDEIAGRVRKWKGNGVAVVRRQGSIPVARALDQPIDDAGVIDAVSNFIIRSDSLYLTRWNELEQRVEVLVGPDPDIPAESL